MAKKLILGYLVLACLSLFSILEVSGAHKRAASSPIRRVSLNDGSKSPTADFHLVIDGHGDRSTRLTINTQNGDSGSGWREWLPTKSSVLYGLSLVGAGVAIGMTLGTCTQMQTACNGAKSDLEPLVSDVQRIVNDFDTIKAVVCQMYPALCPPGGK